ncbi:tRNA dihydrouridine synthase [Aureococcus anophagefferens]|uniref:tRNA dihydrouridine synthase n=1 Tax=Aureococcus anophagefferens TaxID=44056 RepID=A0ABR1G044_AURAN
MDATRFVADAAYRRAVFEAGAGAPADRPLVAQFAGDDPAAILAAARLVEHRVDVVELNCGCPQKVAKRGHFGAFLLDEPEVIVAVVRALKRGLACAVGVKLRVLETAAATVALARRLEAAGADLLTVHGRTRAMKKCGFPCDFAAIAAVKRAVRVPVVANGGVERHADFARARELTGCDCVMSGELALAHPRAFFDGDAGPRAAVAAARAYLALAEATGALYGLGGAFGDAASLADLAARVEAVAGAADLDAAAPSWYRRYRSSDGDIAAFLAARGDAALLPGGRVRCELTGHELAPQLPELEAHWAGRRYRNAAKRAAKDAGRAVT